ncbi:MAG: long-chain fatty acid--CoA ligase [Deltaproteobacteria bacterium]|nr:long-chain fatty acid--CoA ligase [Deltaproteobacteria bacterium]
MTYRYDRPDNLVDLIEDSVKAHEERPVFGKKNALGEYEWITYRELGERIDNLRGGLAQVGVQKDDAVGIIANNRTEWAVCAFATYGLGARYIPMYENELEKIWKYIINDSGIKVLLVATKEIYEKVVSFKDETPALERVYVIDAMGENSMAELEGMGKANPVNSIKPKPSHIASLIYTSGTTGSPKGVLLSHGNFTSNVLAGGKLYPQLRKEDRGLSILPWAHSFGQTGELYFFLHVGGSLGFIENVTTIAEDMAKVKPTFLIAVPKIFNKIYAGLWAKMEETGGLAKMLFTMGVESAKKRREMATEGKSCFFTNLKFKLADTVVFSKIRQRLGGRLTGTLSGSATMNVEISHFFSDIGVPVYDCYGLTETSPAITMNCPTAHRPGSVGRAIDQVRVVIDALSTDDGTEDGEIIAYGPNVMQGYHNNPEATQEVMTEDGGFRTGDRGRLDKDGYLYITGRIKEQYKLVNGKYVFPNALEEEIKLLPQVETVMVYGDGRDYNVALVVPDFEVLEKYARENNLSGDPEALAGNPEVQKMISGAIADGLKGKFGGYEIPRKFLFMPETFSSENGMLTQTMKLKRRNVLERYMPEIESLYGS